MYERDAVSHKGLLVERNASEVGVACEHLEHGLGARLGDAGGGTVHADVLHRAA